MSKQGYFQSKILEGLKATNPSLMKSLVKEKSLQDFLDSHSDSILTQYNQLIDSGFRENEAMEFLNNQIHFH